MKEERKTELQILVDLYDFMKWFLPKISKFSRNYRYTLGLRIENHLYSFLETLINAKFSSDKVSLLRKANTDLEILRYFVRISFDLRLITLKQYEFISMRVNEIGGQIGGWLKTIKN